MAHGISLVLAKAFTQPWAIEPSRGAALRSVLERRGSGLRLDAEEIAEVLGDAPAKKKDRLADLEKRNATVRNVRTIPLWGVVLHRSYELDDVSAEGVMSLEWVTKKLGEALADPGVSAVVLDVDSPGGVIGGVPELAAMIMGASKPVVAVANSWAASAAYWIASAAHELVVTPSGAVGSIGVWSLHQDWSKRYEQDGIANTLVRAGRLKAELNPYGPLSAEGRAMMQESVDLAYVDFVKAVAEGRGEKASRVRGPEYGEGRMFKASQALERGMVDRIGTLEETVMRLASGARVKVRRESALEPAAAEPTPGTNLNIGGAETAGEAVASPGVTFTRATPLDEEALNLADLDLREREFQMRHPPRGEAGAYPSRRQD